MKVKEKAIFCWSGGKDSALALYKVCLEDKHEVVALLTTLNARFKRISMHGVREELLDMQAASIGLPLIKMYIKGETNAEYEKAMEDILLQYREQGVTKVIFGDIFLDELRTYRENNLSKVGLKAEFPLWKKHTSELIIEFLKLDFKTITCCVNDQHFKKEKVGVEIDMEFIDTLPATVDPCGENGEYHSFCYDGPIFNTPVRFIKGEKIFKPLKLKTSDCNADIPVTNGFWYCELLPLK